MLPCTPHLYTYTALVHVHRTCTRTPHLYTYTALVHVHRTCTRTPHLYTYIALVQVRPHTCTISVLARQHHRPSPRVTLPTLHLHLQRSRGSREGASTEPPSATMSPVSAIIKSRRRSVSGLHRRRCVRHDQPPSRQSVAICAETTFSLDRYRVARL